MCRRKTPSTGVLLFILYGGGVSRNHNTFYRLECNPPKRDNQTDDVSTRIFIYVYITGSFDDHFVKYRFHCLQNLIIILKRLVHPKCVVSTTRIYVIMFFPTIVFRIPRPTGFRSNIMYVFVIKMTDTKVSRE